MENFDLTSLPVWAFFILMILNLFKAPLSALFPGLLGFLTRQAQQEEIEAEGRRQDEVAEKLMLANLVQRALDQNRQLIGYLQDVVTSQLTNINERLITLSGEIQRMEGEIDRLVEKRNEQ